jgi:hypothetical protein
VCPSPDAADVMRKPTCPVARRFLGRSHRRDGRGCQRVACRRDVTAAAGGRVIPLFTSPRRTPDQPRRRQLANLADAIQTTYATSYARAKATTCPAARLPRSRLTTCALSRSRSSATRSLAGVPAGFSGGRRPNRGAHRRRAWRRLRPIEMSRRAPTALVHSVSARRPVPRDVLVEHDDDIACRSVPGRRCARTSRRRRISSRVSAQHLDDGRCVHDRVPIAGVVLERPAGRSSRPAAPHVPSCFRSSPPVRIHGRCRVAGHPDLTDENSLPHRLDCAPRTDMQRCRLPQWPSVTAGTPALVTR